MVGQYLRIIRSVIALIASIFIPLSVAWEKLHGEDKLLPGVVLRRYTIRRRKWWNGPHTPFARHSGESTIYF